MKLKGKKRILAFTLCTYLFSGTTIFAETTDSIKDEIEQNKEAIEQLEQDKKEANEQLDIEEGNLAEIESKIAEQNKVLAAAQKKVSDYQGEIDTLQSEINSFENKIINSQNEIIVSEQKIQSIEEEIEAAQGVLDSRMRNFYKMDIAQQYLYTMINSRDFSELLSNIFNIGKIMNYDRELMAKMEESQNEINRNIANIEKNIAIQEESKKAVEEKQGTLLVAQEEFILLKNEEQKQMNTLMALQGEQASTVASIAGNVEGLEEEIMDLVSFNKDLQQQLDDLFEDLNNNNNNNGSTVVPDNGEFLRPVTGPITSPYGPRIHPVTGKNSFHKGIDYGNGYGHPIKSTKSGVVDYSGWMSGYGNVVIVNHGGGVQSLYAHCQDLSVSVGQSVDRGQVVGTVGSTGMSTGPHLHFEIRINGQPQDPYGYIPY